MQKLEIRFNDMKLESNEEGLKVAGYVNMTNQWSEVLGVRKKFIERILPGTFERALQNGNDIHFLAEHDNAKILSSTNNGSLTLREDDKGLFMEAKISETSWGKDYHTLIKDGIIKNMSFGMKVLKDSWKQLADGTYERSISDIYLAEVSAVRNPAYVQSTISARSIEVVNDVEVPEEIEIPKEEKREMTIQEKINKNKSLISFYQKLVDLDGDMKSARKIEELQEENRQMEAQMNEQKGSMEAVTQEGRANVPVTTLIDPGKMTVARNLIKEQVKKMNGKNSLVTRTDILVQEGGVLDVILEDGENYKQSLFVGEMQNLSFADFTGKKEIIETERIGHGIEVSEELLVETSREEQEERIKNKLRGRIEDGANYCMLTAEGNMANLNDDTSVSNIITTNEANKVSLIDTLKLIGGLNDSYRDGAVLIMHTEVFNSILTNLEFNHHLEFALDEVTGKKLYHLFGFPMLVNDNANTKRIIFGNLYEGYKTVISVGPEPQMEKDIFGNPTLIDQRSFVLQKTYDSDRAAKKVPLYLMQAFMAGKVINKDCFTRLDVADVALASESKPEEVVNPTEQVATTFTAESVVEPEIKPEPKARKQSKPKA